MTCEPKGWIQLKYGMSTCIACGRLNADSIAAEIHAKKHARGRMVLKLNGGGNIPY